LTSFNEEKNKYENESLEDIVKNNNQKERIVVTDEKIIQRFEPVFHVNASETFFNAPLFSSVKNFSGVQYRTLPANIFIIWLMTIVLILHSR
jgi:hypothetical protein